MVLTETSENGTWADIFLGPSRVARRYGKKGNARDQSEIGKQVDVLELRREVLRSEKETTGLSKMWRGLCCPKTKNTPRRTPCMALRTKAVQEDTIHTDKDADERRPIKGPRERLRDRGRVGHRQRRRDACGSPWRSPRRPWREWRS